MLHPEEIAQKLKELIGEGLVDWDLNVRHDGFTNSREQKHLYLKVTREDFYRTASFLSELSPLHISCPMASIESEDSIELIYPLMIYSGHGEQTEQPVMLSYEIPKNDLRTRTITDILPGIIIMERETQEMLGIQVEGIPDKRKFFTPDNMKEGFLPLREEEKAVGQEGANE